MTRREVRSCAEGRWECGLGFPARGRKAAGSAPGREPRNHCGHAGRAPPEPGSGRTRPREFFFFFFSLVPFRSLSFLFSLAAGAYASAEDGGGQLPVLRVSVPRRASPDFLP